MIPTPFVSYLPETPSQTAGPYVHIGLIPSQAGFEIFQNNFSGDIAGAGRRRPAHRHRGTDLRWRGPHNEGCSGRDMAGERGRPI